MCSSGCMDPEEQKRPAHGNVLSGAFVMCNGSPVRWLENKSLGNISALASLRIVGVLKLHMCLIPNP
jgi:hypothetical protein